jgi:hypothetical protein
MYFKKKEKVSYLLSHFTYEELKIYIQIKYFLYLSLFKNIELEK